MVYGPIAAFLVELFPARIRYSSMSMPYHIGNGWFGGGVPFIGTAIRDFTGIALGGLICALALKPARRRDALMLTAVCYLGIGLARLSGMLQFGGDSAFLRFAVATELALGVASALLAKRNLA